MMIKVRMMSTVFKPTLIIMMIMRAIIIIIIAIMVTVMKMILTEEVMIMIMTIITRSSWLNCALQGDEVRVSIGRVLVGSWWYCAGIRQYTGWYLVLLGLYMVILFGTWWHWLSLVRYWLVLS